MIEIFDAEEQPSKKGLASAVGTKYTIVHKPANHNAMGTLFVHLILRKVVFQAKRCSKTPSSPCTSWVYVRPLLKNIRQDVFRPRLWRRVDVRKWNSRRLRFGNSAVPYRRSRASLSIVRHGFAYA